MVSVPLGGVMLNWKVSGPALVSVAVAAQVMDVPIFCGDASDGVKDTIVTVAKAGADNTISAPMGYHAVLFKYFMKSLPSYQGYQTDAKK
jgi:hypothetical protein